MLYRTTRSLHVSFQRCRAVMSPYSSYTYDFFWGLHAAIVDFGNCALRVLVGELGADVESKDNEGRTPLHLATEQSRLELIHVLVKEIHADVDAKDNQGFTPLHVAARRGDAESVRRLVKSYRAKVDARDNDG